MSQTDLRVLRDKFRNHEKIPEDQVRDFVLRSWYRCREGLFIANAAHTSADSSAELLACAVPILDRLHSSISSAHSIIGLADRTGLVLHCMGEMADIDDLDVFREGRYATEEIAGTNGIGTCLVEQRPLEIIGPEHYHAAPTEWYCCAAPIFNGSSLEGVLNISIRSGEQHKHTLGLVEMVAMAVSEQLRLRLLVNEQKTMLESFEDGVVILDAGGRIKTMNNHARKLLRPAALAPGTTAVQAGLPGRIIETMLSERRPIYDREILLPTAAGAMQFALSCTPVQEGGCLLMLRNLKRVRTYAANVLNQGAMYTFDNILGESRALTDVIFLARQASKSDVTTLILGESGTGKELFAQSIHNASNRRNGPFVAVNCGAIPRSLLESELFGYEDGAFTGARKNGKPGKFELADGGTVFLDEIGELPLEAQASLLRMLQESTVVRVGGERNRRINIRVLAATNRNLEDAVRQKTFREDLYYRLNVLSIEIPPLRERKMDISIIARFMLDKFSRVLGRERAAFADEVWSALLNYHWPGNVRELENVVERAINISRTPVIQLTDLPAHIGMSAASSAPVNVARPNALQARELDLITATLNETGGNMRQAAEKLGVARCALYRKLRKHGLSPDQWRKASP